MYGTLRDGHDRTMHGLLSGRAVRVGRACYRGRLYDIGDYPGAVASSRGRDRVWGEVYALDPPQRAELLSSLDRYEGAAFERNRVEVTLEDGSAVGCWIYLYARDTRGLRRIASGDYLAP